MGLRSQRFTQRRSDAIETKLTNRGIKEKERARRDARMLERIASGSLPFPPAVMSWLSGKLGKPSTKITQAEVKSLIR